MACDLCSGTDCAAACNQGYCYAEEMLREQERAEREEYEAEMREDELMRQRWEDENNA